jgi:hypothetical protein
MTRQEITVAAAFARGGDVASWAVSLNPEEMQQVELLLGWLFKLGHLAAYAIPSGSSAHTMESFLDAFRARLGAIVVEATLGCALLAPEPAPAYLVPVWPFDHERYGAPASTARFLGVDVPVAARRPAEEEDGFEIEEREGLWLPLIIPDDDAEVDIIPW